MRKMRSRESCLQKERSKYANICKSVVKTPKHYDEFSYARKNLLYMLKILDGTETTIKNYVRTV
jgi:hypothetical protein